MYDKALAALERPESGYDQAVRACALARSGRGAEALEIARSLDARAEARFGHVYAAIAWTCVGDADRAFSWLERLYAEHQFTLAHNQINPLFQPLHGDPRWARLMRRLGL